MRLSMLVLLAGCTAKDAGDSDDLPPINGGDSEERCDGTDPEARAVNLSNGGPRDFDDGTWPTILISVDTYDNDGNLNYVTMELWFEADADGQADTSGSPDSSTTFTLTDSPCNSFEFPVELLLQVGTSLEYNTLYDVAARITDAEGEVSNVAVGTGTTPRADGSDGDGTGP